jgi:hypothetical protein
MTVRMTRDPAMFPAPHTADIHPDEVENAKSGGWRLPDPLDHDHDGKKGGAKPAKAKRKGDEEAGEPPLTRREIEADLVGMGEDFNPAADLADLRKQRDEARAILEA